MDTRHTIVALGHTPSIPRVFTESMDSQQNTLTFGKYSGKTFDYVKQTDVSYCNWVLEQIGSGGKMLQFQQWLRTKARKITCECCNGTGVVDKM